MGNTCCCRCRKRLKKNVCLLLLGLDNAGKTVAVKNLAGESAEEVVPTIGFSVVNLNYNGYEVKVYDLGGGPTIRGIWHRDFVDAHGILFVIDSSDFSRLNEVKEVLHNVLCNEKVSGKPVLILANKQDYANAMDELDLIETLQIEELVNRQQCPTLVESCSAASLSNKTQLDPGIRRGYNWLMNCIIREYKYLNERVRKDVHEEELAVVKSRQEIIERLKVAKEVEKQKQQDDIIELYSNYANKNDNAVKPFDGNLSVSSLDSSKQPTPKMSPTHQIEQPIVEKPTSATQIVKEQLQLHNTEKKSYLRLKYNKTQSVHLCGMTNSQSAQARHRTILSDRRLLWSAGDSVFVVTNRSDNISSHTGGGDLQQHLFQIKQMTYINKPSRNTQGSGGDNAISIIEFD